jgi:hypothetical protein
MSHGTRERISVREPVPLLLRDARTDLATL